MGMWFLRIRQALDELNREDSGQDLVEYAMVAVVIALGAVAGMGLVAKEINSSFFAVAKKFRGVVP